MAACTRLSARRVGMMTHTGTTPRSHHIIWENLSYFKTPNNSSISFTITHSLNLFIWSSSLVVIHHRALSFQNDDWNTLLSCIPLISPLIDLYAKCAKILFICRSNYYVFDGQRALDDRQKRSRLSVTWSPIVNCSPTLKALATGRSIGWLVSRILDSL